MYHIYKCWVFKQNQPLGFVESLVEGIKAGLMCCCVSLVTAAGSQAAVRCACVTAHSCVRRFIGKAHLVWVSTSSNKQER